ncbi:MAG: alpha/beta hydrolase [Microbacteriaceae bacterium]
MTQRAVTTCDGQSIAYLVEPGENPVLLVHGFGSAAIPTWDATGWMKALADAGFGVIAPDLRGHGSSSKPHEAADYYSAVLASDLATVLDAEHLTHVDVIGYSMGSQICRAFARDAPGRIRRLVLGGIGSVEQFSHWGVDAIQAVLLDGRTVADPVAERMLRAALTGPDPDPAALVACAQGVMSDPVVSPPVVPTLVVSGEVDPVAIGAPGFAERMGAEFVSVPKRNHFTTLSSRAFKAAALEFLVR